MKYCRIPKEDKSEEKNWFSVSSEELLLNIHKLCYLLNKYEMSNSMSIIMKIGEKSVMVPSKFSNQLVTKKVLSISHLPANVASQSKISTMLPDGKPPNWY